MPRHRSRLLIAGVVPYTLLVGLLSLRAGIVATPDILLVALVPLAVVSGQFLAWIRDWVPFVGLILGWEAMRGVAYRLSPTGVHRGSLPLEQWLFRGWLPEVHLQQLAGHLGWAHWADALAATVDLLHFPAVIALALVIWLHGREAFLRYSIALFATAFAAFAIFVAAPTAPPWYAVEHGWLGGLRHVMAEVLPVHWSPYYRSLDPNPVAAAPSLHSAMPWVAYLALRAIRSPLRWPMLGWCLAVWVSVVYLGEHYVFDVVDGVALASLCWVSTAGLLDRSAQLGQSLSTRSSAGRGEPRPSRLDVRT